MAQLKMTNQTTTVRTNLTPPKAKAQSTQTASTSRNSRSAAILLALGSIPVLAIVASQLPNFLLEGTIPQEVAALLTSRIDVYDTNPIKTPALASSNQMIASSKAPTDNSQQQVVTKQPVKPAVVKTNPVSTLSANTISAPIFKPPVEQVQASATAYNPVDLNDSKYEKNGNAYVVDGLGKFQLYSVKGNQSVYYIAKEGNLKEQQVMFSTKKDTLASPAILEVKSTPSLKDRFLYYRPPTGKTIVIELKNGGGSQELPDTANTQFNISKAIINLI